MQRNPYMNFDQLLSAYEPKLVAGFREAIEPSR